MARQAGGQCRRRHLSQGGADILILAGSPNWVMGFEPDADRLKVSGMTEAFRAAPARVGEHLNGALPEGGDRYFAWTTLGAFGLFT